LRRSNSTPSETRPATSRRATLKTSRSTPAAAIAAANGHSRFPVSIASTVSPTRKGSRTPKPVAAAASAKDAATPLR
jgi:hypothetical protein